MAAGGPHEGVDLLVLDEAEGVGDRGVLEGLPSVGLQISIAEVSLHGLAESSAGLVDVLDGQESGPDGRAFQRFGIGAVEEVVVGFS